MGKPSWVKVIGILGIVFGSLGLIGGVNTMVSPMVLEFQKKTFGEMRDAVKDADRAQRKNNGGRRKPPPKEADRFFRLFEDMLDVPEWYKTFCIVSGFVTMLICGVYIFASISLLQMKSFAVRFFYVISAISITFNLVEALVGMNAKSFLMLGILVNAGTSIVIDGVLVSVVATGDKKAFEQAMEVVEVVEEPGCSNYRLRDWVV